MMNKVYLMMDCYYEGVEILGCFSSLEKAEYAKKYEIVEGSYQIEEFEIDKVYG